MSFTAPWNTLALFAVEDICPKLPDVTVPLGVLKLGWFKTLKASMRVSKFKRSCNRQMRLIWLSKLINGGPWNWFRF